MGRQFSFIFALVVLVHFQAPVVSSINIVVWQALGTQSTRISMTPLMEELVDRGHNVTLVSLFTSKDSSASKFQTVVPKKLLEAVGPLDEPGNYFEMRKTPWNLPGRWYDSLAFSVIGCEAICSDEEFLSWVKQIKVDMVMMEGVSNDCAYGFAKYWNAKIVISSSTTVTPFMPDAFGLADETSSIGDMIFGFSSSKKNPMPFWQRIFNGLNPAVYYLWREWKHLPRMEEAARKAFGMKEGEMPRFVDIEKNVSLILLTTHYSFAPSRSFPPNVIPIGGAVVSKKAKPLPKDMEQFIDSGKAGFIFISFGTATEFTTFDDDVQLEFIAALAELPEIKFVWKSSQPIRHPLPKNVFVAKWAPQQTLLGHPKIKAFISHMGMGSTTETIHHGVPVIALPVFFDQDINADMISDRNAGITLEILTLKREDLYWAIKEIMNNPKYRDGMKRLSSIYRDRPRSALEDAVWWIEYANRHDNIHEILMPASAHQSWWKKRQLDVWFTTGLIFLVITVLPLYLIQLVVKKLFLANSKSSSTKKIKRS